MSYLWRQKMTPEHIANLPLKKQFYKTLNERQRRLYTAELASSLGHGGIKLVSETFHIDPTTIRIGLKELKSEEDLPIGRIRKVGGGRKKKLDQDPQLPKIFAEVVEDYTAGNPQEPEERWVALKPKELQEKLLAKNYEVSFYIVHQLLSREGLTKRSYLKSASLKVVPNRNEQFEKINKLKSVFLKAGLPMLSLDTKSKEVLGNFYRKGNYYARRHRLVNDHDFKSHAKGVVVPHGIYDIVDNFGYLTLGVSKDTSAFVCDNITAFWQSDLQWKYPDADWLLLLCDGGGSNNSRHHIVKQDFYRLAQRIDMNIIVAHYPPYCSKWNPIEHKLFPHVHRAWDGAVFHNIEIVEELAYNTSTKTGLGVKVRINQKQYHTKRKVNEVFKENMESLIDFDDDLPQWNYSFLRKNRGVIF